MEKSGKKKKKQKQKKEKDNIMEIIDSKPKTDKEKAVNKNTDIVQTTGTNDIDLPDEVALPTNPKILSALKESTFEEGIHYIKQRKGNQETIFFKKQASSILKDLFRIDVRIKDIKINSYISPSAKYIVDKILEFALSLMADGKHVEAGKLINKAGNIAEEKNPADWWTAIITLEAVNPEGRVLEWTGSGIDAFQNRALSIAMTRAFRNIVRAYTGI